jgi:hypothetical protein
VAFGKSFIANPDLPRRFAENAPLNPPDPASFYGPDEKGYNDYPALCSGLRISNDKSHAVTAPRSSLRPDFSRK